MNRRAFLRSSAALAVASPFIAISKITEHHNARKPLPHLEHGSILTADFVNELVTRVNELEQKQ